MPTQAELAATAEHRQEFDTLLTLALAELAELWSSLTGTAESIRDGLAVGLAALTARFGPAAATLGADWYDDMRDAAGAPGRFTAIAAELPDQGRLDSLVGWATQPLFPPNDVPVAEFVPDIALTQTLTEGSFQRLVADMDRASVIQSLLGDPNSKGWSRQTTGLSCKFCIMLAGRGAVYSAKTAAFSSHDNCDCVAVPRWGEGIEVKPYVPSQKIKTSEARAKNNAALRRYLNGAETPGRATSQTAAAPTRDVDAGRTTEQLRTTLAGLERSLARFDSPATRKRVEELRRKIAARN